MLFGLGGWRRWRRPALDAGWRRRHGRRSVVRLKGVLAIDGHLFGGKTRRVPADLRACSVLLEPALGVPPGQQLQPWTGRPKDGTVNDGGVDYIGQSGAPWIIHRLKGFAKVWSRKTSLSIARWHSGNLFMFALITFLSIDFKINESMSKKKKPNNFLPWLLRKIGMLSLFIVLSNYGTG